MASSTDLRVKISADLADIRQGLGLLRGELAKVKAQSAQAFSGGANFTSQLAGMRRALVGLFAGVSAGALFAGIVANTKEAEEAIAQLRAGLKSTGGVAGVTEGEVVALAGALQKVTTYGDDTIIRMASVVATFTNIRGAIFKDAIPAILDLSTRLGTDLNSAAIQVGKALNDPIKGITALGRAGVQFSASQKDQIKGFVEAGKTQEAQKIILRELTTQMGGSATAAADTLSGSVEQLKNAFGDLLEGDSSAGGIKGTKTAVKELTGVLQDASTKQAFTALLEAAAKAATALVKVLAELIPVIKALLENLDALAVLVGTRLALAAVPALIGAVKGLQAAFVALRGATIAWSTVAAALGGPVGLALAAVAAALYLVYKNTNQAKQAEDQHRKVMEEIEGAAQKNIVSGYQMAAARRQEARDALEAAKAQLQLARARFEVENTSRTARGGDRGDAAAFASTAALNKQQAKVAQLAKQEAELTAKLQELEQGLRDASVQPVTAPTGTTETPAGKAIAASNALQRDAVTRAIAEVERLYKASEIGTREYFATLTGLQQQAIDLQIQQARNELAVTKDKGQRLKLEEEIAILQRDRAEVSQRNARDEQQAQDAMIDKLGDVKAQLAELDGDAGKAARIRIEAQFAELFKQLERDSDATGKALVRNLADRLIAKAQAQAIAGRVSAVTGGLSAQEQSISAQVDAGALGRADGERRLQEIRQKSLEQLRKLREEQSLYLSSLGAGTPEYAAAVDGLAGIETSIANIVASMDTFGRDVEGGAFNSLTSLFRSIREQGTLTVDALRSAVADFAASIYDSITGDWAKNIASAARSWLGGLLGNGTQAAAETTAATAAATIQTTAAATSAATVTAGATAAGAAMTTGAVTGATALTTAGAAVAASLVSAAIQAAAILQAQAAASSALRIASAKGNVFDGSGLRAFARGAVFPAIAAFAAGGAFTNQVVASPTLFAFGKGGQLGVMGEAGPEAIMPLERGPGGRLGVRNNSAADATRTPEHFILAIGDDQVANAMASVAGEKVTLLHVRNNWGSLNGGA